LTALLLAAAVFGTGPDVVVDPDSYAEYLEARDCAEWTIVYCRRLTDEQRENIWNRIHFSLKKMYYHLDEAEAEAKQITDVQVRQMTVGAVKGAIAGLSTKNPYQVAIGAALGALAEQADCSLRHFLESRWHLQQAEYYADVADDLQNKLLRG